MVLKVGQTIVTNRSCTLDALVTVPFFVIPNGGSHYTFFTSVGFWFIAFEFLLVASLYWYARVYTKHVQF